MTNVRKESLFCSEIRKMIKIQSYRQVVTMEVNQCVYVRIVERKSRLVNLDIGIWEMEILGTNLGVKNVDKKLLRGIEMLNFIEDLDCLYYDVRVKNKIGPYRRNFALYIPVKVEVYGRECNEFIIRKEQFTKYLYVKDGCRVYFSDADILMMLLQIKSSSTMDLLIEELEKLYMDEGESYEIVIGKDSYVLKGMKKIIDEQMLSNPKDIDITFEDLLILVNLILAKDMMSVSLWSDKPNFLKQTTSKYISLLKYYYYMDENAKVFLQSIGFDVEDDIYSNYDTQEKRNAKIKIFCDFDSFEKSGII